MAGQKETPRQKMIGMMYLVLTALLALQVSNAVLEKFAIINATLETLKDDSDKKSQMILGGILAEAGKSQKANVIRAKENAQKVRELTGATLKSIEDLKKKMLTMSNAEKVDEGFINDHSSKVSAMMMDPTSKEQEGKKYEKLLNDYVQQLTSLSGVEFDKLAKAPNDIPMFKGNDKHANKNYLTFTFENTPPIAALASVTQMETEILAYESKALEKLANDADAGNISFDNIVPMVRPKSSIVAAGATYEAEMFITASSSAVTPEFFQDGKKLEIVNGPHNVKMGKVEFRAQGGGYDPKTLLATKKFTAEIKLSDTTYREEIEYYVAQPVIRVTTGNAPTLYMNCGNNVNIEVPALGTDYKPSFSAGSAARIIPSGKPGQVTIVPKQRKISVNVSNGGANLGNVNFDVKNIPLPRFVAKENSGRTVNMKDGVKGTSLTGLRIVAEPDENFKQEVPKDAVYRIRSMDVIHARGTAPINRMTATNEVLDLGSWRSGFKPGDQIVIEIKTVTRNTYTGETEKVGISSEILRVPIN